MTEALPQIVTAMAEPEFPGEANPKFLIHRNCEITNVYCFKLLSLGDNLLCNNR